MSAQAQGQVQAQAQAQAQAEQYSADKEKDKQKSVMVMEPTPTKLPITFNGSTGSGSDSSDDSSDSSNGGSNGDDSDDSDSDDHDHIWTERERRKKMKNMFGTLHAILPHLHSKAGKATIVEEAVNYIKILKQTLENLKKQKEERLKSMSTTTLGHPNGNNSSREAFMADHGGPSNIPINSNNNPLLIPNYPTSSGFETWFSPNLVLNIFGQVACFSMCSTKKPSLFSTICFVLDKYNIDVLSSHILSRDSQSYYMIQAHAKKESDASSEEAKFIEAAQEIVPLLS